MSLKIVPETAVSLKPSTVTEIASKSLTTKFINPLTYSNHKPKVTTENYGFTHQGHPMEDDPETRSSSFFRKRRWSFNHKAYESVKRKRSYSCVTRDDCKISLPTKFLLGGTIGDPLNLNGLSGQNVPNMSPISSPWHPSPKCIDVVIPPNITDPLNLNSLDNDVSSFLGKRRKRHRHNKRKEDPTNVSDGQLHATTPIGVDVSYEIDAESKLKCLSAPIPSAHSILSPQYTPISRRRRRTMSECASDMVSYKELKLNKITPCGNIASEKLENLSTHPEEESVSATQKPAKKKSKPKFIYGNYNRYYGYRNPTDIEDVRIQSFSSEWFSSKDVLDIGCNVGHLTILVAKGFLPTKIIGLDIDSSLISSARKNIRYYIENKGKGKPVYPTSNNVVFGPLEPPPFGSQQREVTFPENISFKQGNYVLQNDHQLSLVKEEYDTILALSITKWIHLNNGDEGIQIFFKRIYKHLRPGGTLILEPQPWASYKKRKNLTPNIHYNFQNIRLKPEQFREYLLAEVGFLKCEVIDMANHKTKGFRRPIQIYTKSESATVVNQKKVIVTSKSCSELVTTETVNKS